MGRRPRRAQYERCKPADPRASGKAAAWLVVFLVTAWQTASPSLCPGAALSTSDAGELSMPEPVSAEVLADASVQVPLLAAFPAPSNGQRRPPCPADSREGSGGCWQRTTRRPPCNYYEAEENGECYMAVPERPKGRPVAGAP